MSEFENNEALELTLDEMNTAAGGASRYDKLSPKTGFVIYQVVKGDSLSRIAAKHHCTVQDLLTWNPKITDKNTIYAGEYLYIRA